MGIKSSEVSNSEDQVIDYEHLMTNDNSTDEKNQQVNTISDYNQKL